MKVMGWQADVNGAINTTGAVTSIQVPKGTMMPALPSTELKFANNLSADALPGASAVSSLTVYDSLGNPQDLGQTFVKVDNNTWLAKASLADKTLPLGGSTLTEIKFDSTGKNPVVTPLNTASVAFPIPSVGVPITAIQLDSTVDSIHDQYFTAFDKENAPHVMRMRFTSTGATAWKYDLSEINGTTATSVNNGTVAYAAGVYTFGTAPTFTVGTGSAQTGALTITLAGSTAPDAGLFGITSQTYATAGVVAPITFTAPGALQSKISLNVGALTQYGGSSTVQATTQNGYASGSLDSTTIDTSGILVGKFSNGRTQNLGQVALATFNNPGGLARIGDTLFASSNNSGNPAVGTSGTGGRGTLTPGSLEMSNIDLADQFSKMIITQRGFQANSKIITTSDTMLEELVNLKR